MEFSDTIQKLNEGRAETELSIQLRHLIETVSQQGAAGSLTVKITVKRDKKFDNLFTITADTSLKLPKQEPHETAFSLRADGSIIGMHDLQQRLVFPVDQEVEVEVGAQSSIDAPDAGATWEERDQ